MKSESKLNAGVYLGLGANLGNPKETFELSLNIIAEFATVISNSRLYRSKPYGFSDQPPFVNAAARISTGLPAPELLNQLQTVEQALGKKVVRKNGPRLIDLDLLVYDELELETKDLVLPTWDHGKGFRTPPTHRLEPRPEPSAMGFENTEVSSGLQENSSRDSPEDWDFK